MKNYIITLENGAIFMLVAKSGNEAMNLLCKKESILMSDIKEVIAK